MILVHAAYTRKEIKRSLPPWLHHHIQAWLEVRDWSHRQRLVNNCSQFLSYVWLPVLLRTNSMPSDTLLHSWFLFSSSKDVLLTYLITYITTYFLVERVQTKNASNWWANILSRSPVKARFFLLWHHGKAFHGRITTWVVKLFGELITLTVWGEFQEVQWQAEFIPKLGIHLSQWCQAKYLCTTSLPKTYSSQQV